MSWLSPAASSSLLRTGRRIITRTGRLGLTTTWCSKYTPLAVFSSQPPRDPLRVLFCGSDSFSQMSLDALAKEQKRNPELIQSIDVVVRPPKPVGRGMKQLAPKGPMHTLATHYNLPLHEIDTFTGWNLPQRDLPINLIIAVSFGLFVPQRILRASKYGGLNVHPSLLPDLRGPAPLHHAILSRDSHTGVSLQTLSDKTFDAGAVLAQTPIPGVPIDPSWDVERLSEHLAVIGSDMLVQGLRDGIYLPPHTNVSWASSGNNQLPVRHAPKLEKSDYQIQWDSWTASDATLRSVKLHEKLWTSVVHKKGHSQRWTMDGVKEVEPASWTEEMKLFPRNMQGRTRAQTSSVDGTDSPSDENTKDQSNINSLNTIILRQVSPNPKKPQTKSRSIFDATEAPQTTNTPNQQDMRLPYFVDKDKQSIAVPMPRGGFIRIGNITVEGKNKQPAATVVEQYKQNKKSPSKNDDDADSGIPFIFDIFAQPFTNPNMADGLFSWLEDIDPFDFDI